MDEQDKKEAAKEGSDNKEKGKKEEIKIEGEKKEEYEKREQSESEKRVRALTRLYYSKPEVQKALFEFSQGREVVPRYFEGFGKRPDAIVYPSDIMGLVNKGATSFHASEEIWQDPLKINSDMTREELDGLRKNWDLLIDVDSKYLDFSKIAAKLIVEALEGYGIKNYGLKFSGSKGFHVIVSGEAFPAMLDGMERKNMFPEWPRAICEFLIHHVRQRYNRAISGEGINFDALEQRTKLKKEEVSEVVCSNCGRQSKSGNLVVFECGDCGNRIERKDVKLTKRELRCPMPDCYGILSVAKEEKYYFCEYCNLVSRDMGEGEGGKMVYTKEAKKQEQKESEFEEGVAANKIAGLDLVFVAPRHLFRMPYSLHEKTALASVVILKDEIDKFTPKNASPLGVRIREYMPKAQGGEGERLLRAALAWKAAEERHEEKLEGARIEKVGSRGNGKGERAEINYNDVREDMFPKAIKKLLKGGMNDGRKRGLFILVTFLRALNMPDVLVNEKIREWNKTNNPGLKEGYVKSQMNWHMKQKRKIMPPNYENRAFYSDLGLIDSKQDVKNPVVDVMRALRKGRGN